MFRMAELLRLLDHQVIGTLGTCDRLQALMLASMRAMASSSCCCISWCCCISGRGCALRTGAFRSASASRQCAPPFRSRHSSKPEGVRCVRRGILQAVRGTAWLQGLLRGFRAGGCSVNLVVASSIDRFAGGRILASPLARLRGGTGDRTGESLDCFVNGWRRPVHLAVPIHRFVASDGGLRPCSPFTLLGSGRGGMCDR
jgi:hypothetical protein